MKNKVSIEISSESKHIRTVSREILDFLKAHGVEDIDTYDIKLCIEEAVRNAIVHGNKSRKDLPVKISYSLEGGVLKIEIEDCGKGFDPAKLPDPTHDDNILREGGRGVFLIHKLMDKVNYNIGGNKVTMIKNLGKGGS